MVDAKNPKEVFQHVEERMKKAVEHMHNEMKTLRTGRASVSLLDNVTVDYYGTPTPLRQVANLTVADASLITAQPYDPSLITTIERAIMQSNLGLNPSNDGKIVRIPVPQLTEERRKELVRVAHQYAEESRNGIRQARREGNDALKRLEKDGEISQDDEHRGFDTVQGLHDKYIEEINSSLAHKEKDIMVV